MKTIDDLIKAIECLSGGPYAFVHEEIKRLIEEYVKEREDGFILLSKAVVQLMPNSMVDIKLKNGSVIKDVIPQLDGAFWTRDVTGAELFIDESMVTHIRYYND